MGLQQESSAKINSLKLILRTTTILRWSGNAAAVERRSAGAEVSVEVVAAQPSQASLGSYALVVAAAEH